MRKLVRIAAILFVASAFAGQGDARYSLIWKPVQNREYRYAMTVDASVPEAKVVFTSDLTIKVTKIEKNGNYTLKTWVSNGKGTTDVGAEAVDPDPPEASSYDALGNRLDQETKGEKNDPVSEVLDAVMDLKSPSRPVKMGETWSRQKPGKNGAPSVRIDYVASSLAKIGASRVIQVKFSSSELQVDQPVKAAGVISVDLSDGTPTNIEVKIDNLNLKDNGELSSVKLSVVRK